MAGIDGRPFLRLVHSFTLKLVFLALVLLSVPLILYWQFARGGTYGCPKVAFFAKFHYPNKRKLLTDSDDP